MIPRIIVVALGNNRNNGHSLGAFYLNANNALSNANGNNWRSRPNLYNFHILGSELNTTHSVWQT